ncbi:hypothetical protein EYB26_005066 [Talaromyces marneffei]|uniref:uncharacterized protein n=1 Tax=Talaromyces marneffei TaxID=37727 RepID=UPI0012A8502C|nr:uncharacterized protein EYB26_005066 [Talaromyces marneffei]QGA17395.1 hypothetical protein EYB26_005066 [Talaromyces marneffei]
MGRRKILGTVTLQSGGSYTGWSASGVCSREVLQQKFDQALTETRATTLYAETTKCHIERMEKFWTEYCAIFALEPRKTLRECQTARIENFLHWVVTTCTIKKISTVTTYWRQLSQLHITWWQCRVSPQTLKEIFVFIEGRLTKEYGLDNTKSEKPLLEAEEFIKVAAILLLAAYTGSRPRALLNIIYRDLRLYVEKHRKTGQKRKRPKTYIFYLDKNLVFYIITHMISIAFDDEAYNAPEDFSPRHLFTLKAKKKPSQTLVLLGVALGFIYTLTTYCLRRILGNAINDDPNSNAAVRNLVLDHGTGSKIFERNYISRTIRYFTQDYFWGKSSDHESARTASQIGLL